MYYYPPAETKIPLSAIAGAFFSSAASFEKTLCDYLHVENCALGNSGRSLLYLLLKILYNKNNGKKNEVIIPGYTCYSVAAAVAKAGLKIRVYDLDPNTLAPEPDSLKQSITDRTLAVIVQHLFGIPISIDSTKAFINGSGAFIIEDAAQALGATINDQPAGTLSDFGLFSFGRGKPLPAGGGGAIVSQHVDILREIKFNQQQKGYVQIATTAAVQIISKPQFYGIAEMLPLGLGETIFDPDFKVSNISILIHKLIEESMPLLDRLNMHRNNIAKIYKKKIVHSGIIPVSAALTPIYVRFPLMGCSGAISLTLKKMGVRRMYPKAIADEATIKPYLTKKQVPTPGSKSIVKKLITLPTHHGITANLAKDIAIQITTKEMWHNH